MLLQYNIVIMAILDIETDFGFLHMLVQVPTGMRQHCDITFVSFFTCYLGNPCRQTMIVGVAVTDEQDS